MGDEITSKPGVKDNIMNNIEEIQTPFRFFLLSFAKFRGKGTHVFFLFFSLNLFIYLKKKKILTKEPLYCGVPVDTIIVVELDPELPVGAPLVPGVEGAGLPEVDRGQDLQTGQQLGFIIANHFSCTRKCGQFRKNT